MFAFKVLNLKTASTKMVFILSFLCLGLMFLVFAGSGNIDSYLAPFSPLQIKLYSFFYFALSGSLFYKIYNFSRPVPLFLFLFSFILSLFTTLTIFKYSLYLISALISTFNIFTLVTIWRFLKEKHKNILFGVAFSAIYFFILTYFSLGVLITS